MKIILIIAGLFTIIKIFTEAIGVLPDINLALKMLNKNKSNNINQYYSIFNNINSNNVFIA